LAADSTITRGKTEEGRDMHVFIALLLALVPFSICVAQDSDVPMRTEEFNFLNAEFSLTRYDDLRRLLELRERIVAEATLALERRSKGQVNSEADEPRRAAKALTLLRSTDERALAALCENLTMSSIATLDVDPIMSLPAARALIAIGGKPAREAVFESLRKQIDRRELLIRAHVLSRMDPPHIMVLHIQQAIAEQQELQKNLADKGGEHYLANLRQIDSWLKEPNFLDNPKNWP
jgi:hypothetical protein